MRIALGLVACAGLLSAAARPVTCGASIGLDYDGNVFLYSARDESLFLHRADPARFPLRSLDDAVVKAAGRITLRPGLVRGHTTQVGLSLAGGQYVSNPMKSYLTATLRARQYLRPGWFVEASYLLLPRYLIRYYRHPARTGYAPCSFTEHLAGVEFAAAPTPWLDLAPFVRCEWNDYQPPFEFYRTRAVRAGLALALTPLRALTVDTRYEFKAARSQHTAPDISYNQHGFEAGLTGRGNRLALTAGCGYTGRMFTTAAAVDTTHAGRIDGTGSFFGRLTVALSRVLKLEADAGFDRRNSSSPYRADIDEVKNYDRFRAGVGLRWEGR